MEVSGRKMKAYEKKIKKKKAKKSTLQLGGEIGEKKQKRQNRCRLQVMIGHSCYKDKMV